MNKVLSIIMSALLIVVIAFVIAYFAIPQFNSWVNGIFVPTTEQPDTPNDDETQEPELPALDTVSTIMSDAYLSDNLTVVNSICNSIGEFSFQNSTKLQYVYLPNVTTISNNSFWNCLSLKVARFDNVEYIGKNVFLNVTDLVLILNTDKVCNIDEQSNLLNDYVDRVTIYVPESLLEQYQLDPIWMDYMDLLHPITDEQLSYDFGEQKNEQKFNDLVAMTTTEYSSETLTELRPYAFDNFDNLVSVDLLNVSIVGTRAFANTKSMTELSLPSLSSVPTQMLWLSKVSTLNLGACNEFTFQAFQNSRVQNIYVGYVVIDADSNCGFPPTILNSSIIVADENTKILYLEHEFWSTKSDLITVKGGGV